MFFMVLAAALYFVGFTIVANQNACHRFRGEDESQQKRDTPTHQNVANSKPITVRHCRKNADVNFPRATPGCSRRSRLPCGVGAGNPISADFGV
jgi:hypothetical protein